MTPPRPSTMFLAIGRPRPVPVRRVVKYGSKTRGRSSAVDADRRGRAPRCATPPRARCVRRVTASDSLAVPASRARRACAPPARALVRRLTSAVRRRSASVTIGASRVGVERDGATRAGSPLRRRAAASRHSALRSVGAQLEPDRPGEVEHVVDDAVEPADLLVDVGRGLADRPRGCAGRAAASAARP